MTLDDIAAALAGLSPGGAEHIPGDLLGGYFSKSAKGFILETRGRIAAEKFGVLHKCDFQFDASEGVGIVTKRWAS